jgi:membrane-associated phospholipid phosphatase
MIVLMALVPFYLFIANSIEDRALHAPALALDQVLPLQPAWALVYGALYAFLIVLPVFVVRQDDHIRRTFLAYLMVWIAAYICFWVYPTIAPRPAKVPGTGFLVWSLRFLYDADPPYNCFPSLHVAHSFVSALTCYRVNKNVGVVAGVCASLVGLSTLFTKQHYVLDVITGVLLAGVAYVVFLRRYQRERIPQLEQRLAPIFALGVTCIVTVGVSVFWIAYQLSGPS